MSSHTTTYPLSLSLTFLTPEGTPLTLSGQQITYTQRDQTLTDCSLTLQVHWDNYQQIEQQTLFHLQPEIRGVTTGGELQPHQDLTLILGLNPKLLPHLQTLLPDNPPHESFLPQLQHHAPQDPLFSTTSWLIREVQQQQAEKTVSYTTYWIYTNLEILSQLTQAEDEIFDSAVHFLQAILSPDSPSFFTPNLADFKWSEETHKILQEIFNKTSISSSKRIFKKTLLDTLESFFILEEWDFQRLADQSVLHLEFQGNQSQWSCYLQTREADQQILFYSIFPHLIPEDKRLIICEFLMRANSGLIIGNFELDFEDGEIRYKTSLEVEKTNLTPALIRPIVYQNVWTMDRYFRGIAMVLAGDLSPAEAIQSIEQS